MLFYFLFSRTHFLPSGLDELTGEGENSVNKKIESAKTELKGQSTDTKDSATIAGAKKYADNAVSAAKTEQATKDKSQDTAISTARSIADQNKIDIASLKGDENAEGSIKKIAKTYADAAQSTAETNAASDATTKANKAEKNAKDYVDGKVSTLKTDVDAKVASVTATDKSIVVTGTATNPKLAVKLSKNPGVLKLGADGLSAVVTPETPYTGENAVKVEDHKISLTLSDTSILSQSAEGLKATLNLKYNSASKKIQLFGVDTTTAIAEIDATDFIKDGMVDSVRSADIFLAN